MVRKLAVLVALSCALLAATAMAGSATPGNANREKLSKINHIVVIYEENHSFDNLYGGWAQAIPSTRSRMTSSRRPSAARSSTISG